MEPPTRVNQNASTIAGLRKRFRKLCRIHAAVDAEFAAKGEQMPEERMLDLWRERHEILSSLVDLGERGKAEIAPADFNERITYRRILHMELRARWFTQSGQAHRAEISSRLRAPSKRGTRAGGSLNYAELSARLGTQEFPFREFYYVGQTSETDFRDLRGVVFSEIDLCDADLSIAHLELARFQHCDMRGALLAYSRLQGVTFFHCNLAGAKFWAADLRGATIERCVVVEEGQATSFLNIRYSRNRRYPVSVKRAFAAFGRLMARRYDRLLLYLRRFWWGRIRAFLTPRWRNETQSPALGLNRLPTMFHHTDAASLPTWEAPLFKRYVSDEQYLDAVRKTHPLWHWVWGVTSDCGRNWILWALWSQLLAVVFAVVYLIFPSLIEIVSPLPSGSFITYLYFSLVTFTTLGFGDIHAATSTGAIVISIQVIIGYIFLGGLVAMLSDKLARRAG